HAFCRKGSGKHIVETLLDHADIVPPPAVIAPIESRGLSVRFAHICIVPVDCDSLARLKTCQERASSRALCAHSSSAKRSTRSHGKRAMSSHNQRSLHVWSPRGRTTLAMCAIVAASLASFPGSSNAQPNFYANKTITLVVGASVGGGYDVYARAFAPFLSAHIPGRPNVVVKNMPGAGGLASVLHLDAGAPKDGTVITTFNSGVMTNAFANPEQFKVDLRGLSWLGSLNRSFRFCYFWRGRGFSTWADLNGSREATLGSIGVNSGAYNDIALLKHLLRANVRAVSGYPGRSEVHLAIERGELDGECGSKEGIPEHWFAENKIDI